MAPNDDSRSKDKTKANDDVEREPVVDFSTLAPEVVQSYISFFDLAHSYPPIDSSTTTSSSSTSASRKRKGRLASPTPAASRKRTAAEISAAETSAAYGVNTPKTSVNEDNELACPPHFFDADAATNYLSTVASHHFANQPAPKEGEVVVGFLYKCRAKGELNRPLAHYRLSDGASEKTRLLTAERPAQRSK
ncbi:uncharacterized protein MEPE_02258 [Melanopsichium pennsylvanicum]|uniref:Uncharacterized protein n=2 Tax=Melanopsichium pennsylvanicum TaxID=63383 RepID=A0AAJ5C4C4_9BASI|nr:putative protein [Melanopsichium pennsylvanicum 4]SNX83551.1 uncharacterized protein MEPE_02258 [Melanopsichium pennsylvanicum]